MSIAQMTNVLGTASDELARRATPVTTRKHQRVTLPGAPDETLLLIRKGLFVSRTAIPDSSSTVITLLYPGDIACARAIPAQGHAEIITASDVGEIWRLHGPAVRMLQQTNRGMAHEIAGRLADQAARLALHNAVIGSLTGDERVAALLMELALRTGKHTPAGIAFAMPLSRLDIAEHLALNADTVSRIMSRMRASGLITMTRRRSVICRDLDSLARACPLGEALARVHGTSHASEADNAP
ncbi:MAG: Crp/Fnr family transcriptional regulator [Hyphomicrobium sp.]|uniref:Crp/Fnr family transcriptional regulator n=1 Tax=Hyphomicrobium sp. TaxID=82 RepID=UPI003D13E771